jgi:CSLREA domain-containing protein
MPRLRHLIALPFALAASAALGTSAHAATLTVNSIVDASDASPGNGICASGGNACTLRAALDEAAAIPGVDTITVPAGTYQLGAGLGTLPVLSSVTINGAGARATTIRAAAGTRTVSINATSTLRDLTITGGSLSSASAVVGGGVRITAGDVTLERVTVRDNQLASSQSASGAGIGVEAIEATITLIDSTVSGNTALGHIGANNQGAAVGGGIYTAGAGIIKRSTIANNAAVGGATNYASGGGAKLSGLATIEQSTFAGNGVATVSDSSGFRQGGNLYLNTNATISGSVFATGTASYGPDCYRSSGTVTEPARNLSSTNTDCFGAGSLRGVDPKLGGLADNGGPTDTLRPAAGSPVIDAAANCGSRTTDQRGNTLFGGTGCDLGAIEVAASRTVTLQSSKASAAAGEDLTLIAKLENAGFDQATGETLTLELPAGVTATTATTSAGSCAIAGNVTCELGTVARGTSVTVIVTARASGSAFAVTARRGGSVPDQNTADDVATVQIGGLSTAGGASGGPSGGPGTTPNGDATAPVLTGVRFITSPKPTRKRGAKVRLTLSEAATVQVTVERLTTGRRSGATCKARGTGKRCQRAVEVATFSRSLGAGAQTLTLTRKQVKAGRLRVTLLATDAAGNRSAASSTQATVR